MASEHIPRRARRYAVLIALGVLAGCGSDLRRFPLKDPLWFDPDMRPFQVRPEEYFSPLGWDAADQTLFRPVSKFFAVDPGGEAVNVNALDEVPDSSWFTNRLGKFGLTPSEAAQGPCAAYPALDPRGPWTVTGAKPNGENPGFLIKAQDDKRYLLKFDGTVQGQRATGADSIVSRMYHAAGYFVPCNRVVYFDRKILRIDPEADAENSQGAKVPLSNAHLDKVFAKALRAADGRYRASASMFLEGKPVGPWTFQGTRSDDPNDVVRHEDRREIRASRLLAAWTNHFDSREQNTLGTWMEVEGGRGYVRHNFIDFADSFGSIWEPPMLGRRIGHAYYLDIPYVTEDFLTLGLVRRPWDGARFGPSGRVLGYYDAEPFDPELWRPGYPNPAFGRMTERDAAWMARIIADMGEQHITALIATAQFGDEALERELEHIVVSRRLKILRRYLTRLSPLSHPQVSGARLCLRDLAVSSGIARMDQRRYATRAWLGMGLTPAKLGRARIERSDQVCVALPAVAGAASASPQYLIVDLIAASDRSEPSKPARLHFYHLGGTEYRLVGFERPYDFAPPAQ